MTNENNTNKYTVEKEVWREKNNGSGILVDREFELTKEKVRELASQLPKSELQEIAQAVAAEEILEDQKPKTVYDLEKGDEFYLLNNKGEVVKSVWNNYPFQRKKRKQGNVRLNPEPLRRKAKVREAVESIRKYKLENGLMFEPKHDLISKYYIELKDSDEEFHTGKAINWTMDTQIGYFKTREDAEQVIRDCREELEVIFNLK